MRDYKRKKPERLQIKLRRGADGRLRSAAADSDIGDIWAEQKRIRLAEAIAEDQRRAEKKKQRKERFLKRLKKATTLKRRSIEGSKEVELHISIPQIKLPWLSELVLLHNVRRRLFIWGSIGLAVLVVSVVGYSSYAGDKSTAGSKQASSRGVVDSKSQVKAPEYETVLPKGKSIQDLGGWSRISPPDKEPVFAYIDIIGGVQINVSQQPLPESFKKDTAGEVAKLAEQFSATEKLMINDLTVYVGTSIKGPQSVVFVKDNVLVLIKSATKLTNQQWTDYVMSLGQ